MRVACLLVSLLIPLSAQTGPDAAALAKKALEARESGRLEESIRLYGQALAAGWSDPEALWYQGLNFYDLNRYGEAEEMFRRLVERAPTHAGAQALLGLCEFQAAKFRQAFTHLLEATKLGLPPGSELSRVARYHLVALTNKLGQFELASSLLADLVRTWPDMPDLTEMAGLSALRLPLLPAEIASADRERITLAGRAAVLAWRSKLDEALAAADELLEKYPAQPNAHYLRGYILLLKHSPEAVEEFRKELEISPRHVQARLQIAYEHLQRGDPAGGLRYAEEAVKLAPEDFTALDIYGRLLLQENRVEEAIQALEKAVKLAPESAQVHFHLASAYSRAGRKEDAARHTRAFQRLKKAAEEREAALGAP